MDDKKSRGLLLLPKERGVWKSQGGRKDKFFFPLHSLGLYNNNVSCLSREGNDTPLQYFCLENPIDGGAWWAAVHGVARVGHD